MTVVPDSRYRIAIDIGGTFTDCVVVDEATGALSVIKVPSTPADPSIGFMHAMDRALGEGGIDPAAVSLVMHATTVATNAILERRLARTAFVVTHGFADLLEIGRQIRPRLYDLDAMKPAPLVPRSLCFEVRERLASDGGVIAGVREADVETAVAGIAAAGVAAVVVCFLHSYINPAHEVAVADRIRARLPHLFVSASSRICMRMGEFPRACTALVNAGLVPHISFYFARLTTALTRTGIPGALQVMKSDGGLMPVELVVERPVEIIESGPAAGVVGAAALARHLALPYVLCFDMGGTTAKAGLLINGEPILAPSFEVGEQAVARVEMNRGSGYPIMAPVIDLVEVGAGGGSIAWIDSGGIMRVGPRSAGAHPGPASYGHGATEPTVTDANVVLGRIDPEYFLGGTIKLDHDAAWRAIETRLARPLDMSVPAAALGVLEVANATMLGALRMVSVQRGYDPRDFTIICFGGAAGLQADALMQRLDVVGALIPPSPGVGTARGMMFADVRREFRATHLARLDGGHARELQLLLDDLSAAARSAFATITSARPLILEYAAELRFLGQSHRFRIRFSGALAGPDDLVALAAAFRAEHARIYGFAPEADPVELVELVVTTISRLAKPRIPKLEPGASGGAQARTGTRAVWLDPSAATPVAIHARHKLGAGDIITGPAIVEAPDSTILVGIDSRATVDDIGNVLITRSGN